MSDSQILIVDDEPSNLATLKQILAPVYPLIFARNGSECLAAVRKHQPALILLDVQMPDLDGYAVCRLLKGDPSTASIPIIFVSALGDVGNEAAGFACGGVDYIIKPVSPALVRARVKTHLSLVYASTLERYVKQLELERAKTARLSRIHSVLSGTNSAIVRTQEPQALFEEACSIAVEHGGFGIAWIGLAAPDSEALSLAASQGVAAELLADAQLLAPKLTSLGMDLPHRVLQQGAADYCNDVAGQAAHDRTCQDAQERGYRSLIGLPLNTNATKGVMVLYASELNYFDDAELKLLCELAGDISFALQSIENAKRANFLSYYDALTELPNTALFLDRLEQLIQAARRELTTVYTIALNLDHFKQLNDSFGRHTGDEVLKIVGVRLNEGLSHSCSVARIGADNFALMGEQINAKEISAFCDEILGLLGTPILIGNQQVNLSAHLGIAIYPADAQDNETLFQHAEIALKQAKTAKLRYSFYSPEINARVAEKLELESKLKQALEGEQFVLYYQPKVDLRTGIIIGAEALIRWQDPHRGLIGPGDFIPLAEETGLIVPMGAWVINQVCAQQAAWLRDQVPVVPVALNVSTAQFRDDNVLTTVRCALAEHDLAPNWLALELTESLVMQNPEEAEVILHSFRKQGLHLSLDDFGTGYSSLAYLKRFPFDAVKIDRGFVTDITHDPEDAAIASAIIGMAHSLHLQVIAEGVETEAQLQFLRALNCDQFQGYFFSRPIAAENFKAMLCSGKHLILESDTHTEAEQHIDSVPLTTSIDSY